jgi:hypothetical protein
MSSKRFKKFIMGNESDEEVKRLPEKKKDKAYFILIEACCELLSTHSPQFQDEMDMIFNNKS